MHACLSVPRGDSVQDSHEQNRHSRVWRDLAYSHSKALMWLGIRHRDTRHAERGIEQLGYRASPKPRKAKPRCTIHNRLQRLQLHSNVAGRPWHAVRFCSYAADLITHSDIEKGSTSSRTYDVNRLVLSTEMGPQVTASWICRSAS